MIELDGTGCKVAVFVCTNERSPDKSCCKKVGGMEFYQALKQKVKESQLQHSHWISRSGCLGFCNDKGTAVVIFKSNHTPKWFNEVTSQQTEEIWKEIIS
ncbi:MAG: (2Fe-2S) ferredoxin domain-containing protein [Proteobacteria bacterium]|nr:(2Fe-2S) ferredoxin domain-containing protein [Pseudomonadota bacterium]NDC23367.1 (2Fe-2S) ferredoxin domain-containing protein [Pseudomonadota bacterium]NDD03613.1 (2Fe-2S) ferredoxin domain-containing protein [Pseudomonadota bacterium]NDG26339.1 (2Fe-2S) ferredoxin domain-containing protein [Pseudomonadota bacterium]